MKKCTFKFSALPKHCGYTCVANIMKNDCGTGMRFLISSQLSRAKTLNAIDWRPITLERTLSVQMKCRCRR
jgi:hypothetical protein